MAVILDGKETSKEVRSRVAEGVESFRARTGRAPGLAVVILGEDPGSVIYTRNKAKAAKKCGMYDRLDKLPDTTTEPELLDLVASLNEDERIDGILVQLPLPEHIDEHRVIESIRADKDADGFHPESVGKLSLGLPGPVSCTPKGILTLLDRYGIDPKGMEAVVLGRSNIVGKPMAMLLTARHATVTMCHSRTKDLAFHTRRADLLVSAMGRPRMITGDMVRPGVVAVDVGINRLEDGTLVGDLDYESVANRAGAITPVPGGVGPMTIATLLDNVLELSEARSRA
jgi:methylenetetrahydrofolate dehydrogenase (NADP+)/methenyltetrahydrofolate cyclohydrolase